MTIGERIKEVRKLKGYTQQAFADTLGLKRNTIATYEIGNTTPSDRTISDICKMFGVDRTWIVDGIGEPFRPVNRNEQIAAVLGQAIGSNATARDRLIRAFSQLPDEMFEQAEKILEEVIANLEKEKE